MAFAASGDAQSVGAPSPISRAHWRDPAVAAQQTGREGAQAPAGQPAQQPQGQPPPDQQPPAEQGQTPQFRTGINFVRVDVIVSDKNGAAISDLKQTDFEVVEDGKPQTIETFKLIKLDGGTVPTPEGPPRQIRTDQDEETEAAKDDVRLFGIFLDDYHTKLGSSLTVRDPLSRFIETQLGPSDMVGVMRPLQPLDSVRMTRNHSAIIGAVQQFRGRKGDYTPMNELEQKYVYYPAETVENIRNQVSLSALKAFIIRMGGLKEGRKSLILISEGYSNVLPPQLRDPVAAAPGIPCVGIATSRCNPNAGNPNAGNSPNEDRYAFFANQDLEFHMQGVYEVANQYNVAIYAVDPRGLAPFEYRHRRRSRRHQRADRQQVHDGHAKYAERIGARDRWPRDLESQRSRRRHEADHSRFERVLPPRLHLHPGEGGRKVPRDLGQGEASWHPGPREEGILGLHPRSDRARDDAKSRPAASRRSGARDGQQSDARASHPDVGRHVARSQRKDQSDVRLGTESQDSGRPSNSER